MATVVALWLVVLAAFVAVSVEGFNQAPAPFWWLNSFLQNQTIGRFEDSTGNGYSGLGPCPTFAEKCVLKFANLSNDIKAIGVTLPQPFDTTVTIGQALPSGELRAYLVEVNDAEISNVIINGNSNSTFQNMSIVVNGFKANVRMKLQFADIHVPGLGTYDVDVVAKTNKAAQTVGTNIAMQVFFNAPPGTTLATSIPNDVSLGPCNIKLDLQLSLNISSIAPFQNMINSITNIVEDVAEPFLGNAVCGIIRQLFTTVNGQDGLIRHFVNTTYTAIGNLSYRADPNIAAEEAAMVANLTPLQKSNAITFANNKILEGASKVLNNWLGAGNPTNPLVNEVVNLLTSPNNGTATFTNLTALGVSLPIVTPVAKVTVDVINATLIGLNSFGSPNGFQLIKNNYDNLLPRLNYTLDNRFSLAALNVSLVADIKIERNLGYNLDAIPDGWIFNRPPLGLQQTSFRLNYNLGLKNLDVIAAIAVALDPTQLGTIQMGQLFGKSGNSTTAVGQLIDGARCASPSLYGFTLPSLQLNLSDIVTPVFAMTPADTGIITLVNDVTAILLKVLESPTTKDLPKISQFFIRPIVNSLVSSFFVSGGTFADCPVYLDQGKMTPDFIHSSIFSTAKNLIHDVIGGNPVQSNKVSINELLQQVVQFACEAFASPATCFSPSAGKWRFAPALSLYPGKSFPGQDSFLSATGVDVNGLNSVTKLILDNVLPYPQGIAFLLEIGAPSNPLDIILKNHWFINYALPFTKTDVDEFFNLSISIRGFKLNATILPDFDLNQLYLLEFNDLFHSACLLSPFASLSTTLDLSMTNISVLVSTTPGPTPGTTGNDLRVALNTIISEQGSGYPNLKTMVDFVLRSVGRFVAKQSSGLSNSVINATNCRDQTNLFNTFLARVVKSALTSNLTDVIARATGPQPAVPNATTLDASIFQPLGSSPFDLSNSLVVPMINNAVSQVSQQSMREVLQTLGNGTGDILSDSFTTESDESVSLDIDFMNYTFFQSGFDLSFLIENATFFLYRVRLTNLTNLDMTSIRVAKPLSKFVTDTYISIPGRMSFLISLGIQLPQAFKGLTGPDVLTNINFTMDLVDLEIALQTLTALDARKINGLSLGHFVSIDANQTFSINTGAINCLLGLFLKDGLSLPKLQIGLSSIGIPTISASRYDFVSNGAIRTIETMIRIFADFYVKDLRDLTQGGLRTLINDLLLKPNLDAPGPCLDPPPPSLLPGQRILNFQKSGTIGFLNGLTKNILSGKDGKYKLFNSVVNAALDNTYFFKSPDNQLGFNGLDLVYKKQSLGQVSFAVRDINLKGLGTFTNMNLLEAKSNISLANNFSISGPFDFSFGFKWLLQNVWAVDDGTGLTDELEFILDMTNVTLGLTVSMEIDVPDLLLIQAGSFNNISQISCVLQAFRKFNIDKFVFDVDKIKTTLKCAGVCESPLFKSLAAGTPLTSGDSNSIADYIPQLIKLAVTYLNSASFASTTQGAIDSASQSCIQALNLSTVIAIFNPPKAKDFNVAIIFALALLGIGAALVVLAPLAIPRHYQLKDKMLAANLLEANSEPGANPQSVAKYMAKAERHQLALAWHPAVNKCCKCFVPVMAMGNVLLLALSFIVYLSFSVDARLILLGSETKTYPLVPWTISSTINDMWNSGAWPLSVLIVFASCAWPVVKNIALFAIWFAPKTFLSHEKRHWLLVQLDILGKWSFLDVYIIVLLVGGLRFTLVLSEAPLLQVLPIPQQLLMLDVIITPGIGIVLLCIAAFMSLIVNHVIIWELEKAEWADRRLFKQIDGEQDDYLTPKANIRLAISEYVFSTTAPNGQRDRYGPRAKNSVILLICTAIVFVIVGDIVPYFSQTYDGVVGIALAFFIQGGRKRTFSLFSIGALLPGGSTGTPYYNALFLFFTVLYFATVIVAPILQLALHLFLWLRPLSIKDAHTVMFFAKVAAYWAAIEVFCLAIIALTIEVRPVTLFLFDFITGGTCSVLRAPLTDYLGERDGSCLTPTAYVEWGFAISFASNLFQIFVGAVMIRASGVAIRDREDVLERRPHQEWTILEYLVLDRLLVHGAKHHKPTPKPNKNKGAKIFDSCTKNPAAACLECGGLILDVALGGFGCGNPCIDCCLGVTDVSLAAPVAAKSNKVANSKWNAPASSPAASNRWNAGPSQNYGAPSSPSPSWNMSQTPSQMVAQESLESPNPIFAREQQSKRYSVDV